MIKEVKIPELGENIETAEVTSILVKPGDAVKLEQALLEVESDKASVEVPAPFAGVVKEIRVKAGQKIKVGQVIVTIDDEASAGAPPPPSGATPAADAFAAQSSGAAASPPPAPITAPSKPTPAPAPATPSAAGAPTNSAAGPRPGELGNPAAAAPSVRRLARELGVDINRVPGSGPGGRISRTDVKQYVKSVVERRIAGPSGVGGIAPAELPDFTQWGPVRREAMSGVRRKTSDKMVQSWTTIPHVTQFDEADVTALEDYRKRKAKDFEKRGVKLTVTAALLKTLALALRKFPKFNASVDLNTDEIIFKEYVHIGVAVDTDRGLLVPVIRDADKKGILDLSRELNDLAERARNRKTKPDELQGSNISLTNLGGLGTTFFTPIINWPDVAVLGVGRAKTQAIWADGGFVPRMILPLSISYDHRVIDGADAARFLRWICEALEEPIQLSL